MKKYRIINNRWGTLTPQVQRFGFWFDIFVPEAPLSGMGTRGMCEFAILAHKNKGKVVKYG